MAGDQGPREIERKYLLDALPDEARATPPVRIEQGWLPGEVIHERIRRAGGPDGVRCSRTIKLGRGLVREEFEEAMTEELFAGLWPFTAGRRVIKDRFRVPDGALTWEIDAFRDRELFLAEVELPAAATAVVLPPWLAAVLVREVTDEPTYVNLNLAG
jgi:CYTH domain-containing protein